MEQFLHNNSIFIVLTIVIMILLGIVFYMFAIDRKVSKLEVIVNDEEFDSTDK